MEKDKNENDDDNNLENIKAQINEVIKEIEKDYNNILKDFLSEVNEINEVEDLKKISASLKPFKNINIKKLRVIILGNSPYPDINDIGDRAFGSNKLTPSLMGILSELSRDLILNEQSEKIKCNVRLISDIIENNKNYRDYKELYNKRQYGKVLTFILTLQSWEKNGILLSNKNILNISSEINTRWQTFFKNFLEKIINIKNKKGEYIVLISWGEKGNKIIEDIKGDDKKFNFMELNEYKEKGSTQKIEKNLLLQHYHPQCHKNEFFFNNHFSITNEFLRQVYKENQDYNIWKFNLK